MTVFSPDVHTHVKPRTALLHIGIFVAAFFGIVGATQMTFEPLQANRRTYPYNGMSFANTKSGTDCSRAREGTRWTRRSELSVQFSAYVSDSECIPSPMTYTFMLDACSLWSTIMTRFCVHKGKQYN